MSTHLPPPSTSTSPHPKTLGRKIEHCCCTTFAFFPLAFVYGLTSWAVYTEVRISFLADSDLYACLKAAMGLIFYALANISYTIAVFTNAGSPLDPKTDLSLENFGKKSTGGRRGYDVLPTYEQDSTTDSAAPAHSGMTAVTAKSSGKQRFCKKCQTVKPDRTHHCSSCKRCVLKMDHHCPWLATCVGLRNYKPFLLFLIYTCLFCWLCLGVTGSWVWAAIANDSRMQEGGIVVNTILLAVLSGIIGLVLTGFTGWHVYLALTGQTTIESLEKTRYLNPLRKSMERTSHQHDGERPTSHARRESQSLLDQLKETHANALPGVLRPEEGEDERSRGTSPNPPTGPLPPTSSFSPGQSSGSPAKDSLQRTYASMEAQREHDRYAAYLDEKDSEKLPNAFNLGWKRNLLHVFGNKPLLWFLPVCNTSGDGWTWEVSPQWYEARAEVDREREARAREESALRELDEESVRKDYRWVSGQGFVDQAGYHRRQGSSSGGSHVPMQPLDRRKGPSGGLTPPPPPRKKSAEDVDSYDTSSDEDAQARRQQRQGYVGRANGGTANWNDIPEDFLGTKANGNVNRSGSRVRQKGD